jgi:hypothetical protein
MQLVGIDHVQLSQPELPEIKRILSPETSGVRRHNGSLFFLPKDYFDNLTTFLYLGINLRHFLRFAQGVFLQAV